MFSKKKATLVMGDFNHADIDWDSLQASSSSGKMFLDTMNDLFLTQHVQGKTRGDSILDLVLSTEKDMVEDLLMSNPISNNDHSMLLWNLECETVMEDCMIKQFNYHKGNYDKIISELLEIDWDRKFMGKGAEEMWEIFLRITLDCRDKYIPMRERSEKGNKVWMKPKIMKMIKKRNKKWKKFSESPSFETKSGYIALRNKVTTEIRRAKEEQEKKIAEKIKVDPKSFYAYIRNSSQTKVKVGPLRGTEGEIVSDNLEMAKILNEFFSSTFTKENLSNLPEPSKRAMNGRNLELNDISIDEEKVRRTLDKLQDNKAAG